MFCYSTNMKNECGKMRPKSNPYETWQTPNGSWTWQVLKKWQADDNKPYARWFCNVITPIVPQGEMGDVYVAEIKSVARKVDTTLAGLQSGRGAILAIGTDKLNALK